MKRHRWLISEDLSKLEEILKEEGFDVEASWELKEGKGKPGGSFESITARLYLNKENGEYTPASKEIYNLAKANGYRFKSNIRNTIKWGLGMTALISAAHLVEYLI